MSATVSASEARACLPEILDRVLAGEEITVTRHGKAVAVVVRPDTLRTRRADVALAAADHLRERLALARAQPLAARPALNRARADALVAELRRDRDRQQRQHVATVDAFDADVLIYAAAAGHPLGRRVRALFPVEPVEATGAVAGLGSVLLLPELLAKPLRDRRTGEVAELETLLSRLDLRPTDQATAELATALAASYGLRAVDSIHLATAVAAGADRFLTNNHSDFPKTISEIDVTYPSDLPDHEPGR